MKKLLILLGSVLAISCAPVSSSNGVLAPEIPTVQCPLYTVTAEPILFESAFFPDTQVSQDSLSIHFQRVFLGNLPVTSGYLIASDPVALRDEPFTQVFEKGHFPVELALADFEHDERVAFARVLFSNEAVARWELALIKGQQTLPVKSEKIYGYSVDAGVGMFLDQNTYKPFNQFLSSERAAWDKIFIRGFKLDDPKPLPGLLYTVNDHVIAAFSTGFGDGSYATYIGFDKAGKPCRLLTDFQVVDWLNN
ncbi:DUF4241 domain-containing protein [Hymenobacter sp. HD11105]